MLGHQSAAWARGGVVRWAMGAARFGGVGLETALPREGCCIFFLVYSFKIHSGVGTKKIQILVNHTSVDFWRKKIKGHLHDKPPMTSVHTWCQPKILEKWGNTRFSPRPHNHQLHPPGASPPWLPVFLLFVQWWKFLEENRLTRNALSSWKWRGYPK